MPRTLVSLALPLPGVVACAFVMGMAAAQVIQSAVNELLGPERLLEVDPQPHRASLQTHVASLHTLSSQPARHSGQPAPPMYPRWVCSMCSSCRRPPSSSSACGPGAAASSMVPRQLSSQRAAVESAGGPVERWAVARAAALTAWVQRRGCGGPLVQARPSPTPLPLSAPRCKEVFRKTQNVTVEAVAQDNLNDVLTNAVALASAIAAASVAPLWVVDPIGAILLSLFIIGSWVRAATSEHGVCLGGGVCVAACAWQRVHGACRVHAGCIQGACRVPTWCAGEHVVPTSYAGKHDHRSPTDLPPISLR